MNNQQKISPQVIIGLIILLLGLGYLFDRLDLWNFGQILERWWPLILIGIGILSLLNAPHNRPSALIIIGIGTLLQLSLLDMLPANLWSILWPFILIIIGLFVVFSRPTRVVSDSDETIDIFVGFSGVERKISGTFQGGNITALFGGVKLDFLEAQINDPATLHIFTAFGGVEIRVPEQCRVKILGTPIFGGWEDQTKAPKEGSKVPTLIIRGTVLFGGVRVTN